MKYKAYAQIAIAKIMYIENHRALIRGDDGKLRCLPVPITKLQHRAIPETKEANFPKLLRSVMNLPFALLNSQKNIKRCQLCLNPTACIY